MANENLNTTLWNPVFTGVSRFLHMFKRTPAAYGLIQLDMQLWTVDGTNGATYAADTGTDGKQQHPTLTFAYQTADDLAFIRFVMPPDYNKEQGEIKLMLYWYESGTDNTKKAVWAGTVHRAPAGESVASGSDYAGNAKLDTAGTAFTSVSSYSDGSANEISCATIDLTTSAVGAAVEPLDLVFVKLFNDVSEDSLGATPVVCGAALLYSR